MFSGAFTSMCTQKEYKEKSYCQRGIIYSVNLGSSALLGLFGACMIWTGQFVYLTNSGKKTSKYFAVFYCCTAFCNITSNFFNYMFLSYSPNIVLFFSIFSVVSTLGIIGFTMIPKVTVTSKGQDEEEEIEEGSEEKELVLSSEEKTEQEDVEVMSLEPTATVLENQISKKSDNEEKKPKDKKNVKEVLVRVFQLFTNKRMIRLMPFLLLSGVCQGLPVAALYRYTVRTIPDLSKVETNKKIALTMMSYGFSAACTGLYIKIKLNMESLKAFLVITSTMLMIISLALLYVFYYPNFYFMFVVSFGRN